MGDFENTRFMSTEFHNLNYSDLPRTKLILERGICLDKVEVYLSGFHAGLSFAQWMCFSLDPCYAKEKLVS